MNVTKGIFFIIAAIIVIGLIAACVRFLSIFMKKEKDWKALKRHGQAEIVRWVESGNTDDARQVAMAVILGIENQKSWPVRGLEGLVERYPVGSVVDVEYAQYPYMGVNDYIDIRLAFGPCSSVEEEKEGMI